jgi:hypothetical protein
MAFFSKPNVTINFLHNLPSFVLNKKRHFFRRIFRRTYFKNHNIGPSTVEKSSSKFRATTVIFKRLPKVNNLPKFAQSAPPPCAAETF